MVVPHLDNSSLLKSELHSHCPTRAVVVSVSVLSKKVTYCYGLTRINVDLLNDTLTYKVVCLFAGSLLSTVKVVECRPLLVGSKAFPLEICSNVFKVKSKLETIVASESNVVYCELVAVINVLGTHIVDSDIDVIVIVCEVNVHILGSKRLVNGIVFPSTTPLIVIKSTGRYYSDGSTVLTLVNSTVYKGSSTRNVCSVTNVDILGHIPLDCFLCGNCRNCDNHQCNEHQ